MEAQKNQNDLDYFIFKWLWLIILLPKPVQLIAFMVVIYFLLSRVQYKIRVDYVVVLMSMLAGVHFFSILYNIAEFRPDVVRIAGALNTMMLWPIAAMYFAYYKRCKIDILLVGKYCTRNLLIMCIPAIIATIMYYGFQMKGYLLLGKALFETTYISDIETIKFFGFNDFSNINLFYIMLNLMLSLPYLNVKGKNITFVILLISSFEVFLIHSRAGMVLFSVSVLFAFMETVLRKYRKIILLLLSFLLLVVLIAAFGEIYGAFINTIIYGNESSTATRFAIYITSIEKAWDFSPVWGMGIKEVFDSSSDYVVYLGSHSTYIGFFYKTGFIGLMIGLLIFFVSNWMVIKKSRINRYVKMMMLFLLSFFVLFAIEDVDGTNWTMFLYFSVLSILTNKVV